MNCIKTKTYTMPPVSRKEMFRYAGAKQVDEQIEGLADACIALLDGGIKGRVCYGEFPCFVTEKSVIFPFGEVLSTHLAKALSGCDRAILFGATVGMEFDRLINRLGVTSPAQCHMLSALGTERIEALCDMFCEEIAAEKGFLTPRFSPGYGDLPVTFQQTIFTVLDCSKRIGLTLNNSLLMSPSKSVTAIMGIGQKAGMI